MWEPCPWKSEEWWKQYGGGLTRAEGVAAVNRAAERIREEKLRAAKAAGEAIESHEQEQAAQEKQHSEREEEQEDEENREDDIETLSERYLRLARYDAISFGSFFRSVRTFDQHKQAAHRYPTYAKIVKSKVRSAEVMSLLSDCLGCKHVERNVPCCVCGIRDRPLKWAYLSKTLAT